MIVVGYTIICFYIYFYISVPLLGVLVSDLGAFRNYMVIFVYICFYMWVQKGGLRCGADAGAYDTNNDDVDHAYLTSRRWNQTNRRWNQTEH